MRAMTPADAARIRDARRARVRAIRRRVIGGTVALFLAVWSLIAVRLITGHDPALARHALVSSTGSTGSTGTTGTTGSTGSTTSSTTGGLSSSGASSSTGNSGGDSTTPVTSRQS